MICKLVRIRKSKHLVLLSTIFLLSLSFSTLYAQNPYLIKGSVIDTAANIKLRNATVIILNSKDSIIVNFSRTVNEGSFKMNLPGGKFILLVTYPGYADYTEPFMMDSTQRSKNFGQVNMILKTKLLEEVIVKGARTAIKIKGDTTEYNAGNFTIELNSRVEDLLKQLPGIEVDRSGKITAQGQPVTKVLIDGEEFFGDDPTLITRNIRGDMVDKVQLYDKKSDQATFAGVDDGVKTKTINLKLREDKKSGHFGKIDVGAGSDENYQGQAMFNQFKTKAKFSVYSTSGNTGTTGLNRQDIGKYAIGSSDDLSFNGQGIPIAHTGGLHYDRKWRDNKESINVNYKIGVLSTDGTRSSFSQNNLPESNSSDNRVINSNSNSLFNNYSIRQKMDAVYETQLDSNSTLKVSLEGIVRNNRNQDSYFSKSNRANNTVLNENQRTLFNEGEQNTLRSSVFWSKRLKKKRRSLSVNLSQSYSDNETDGMLNSLTNYCNNQGFSDSLQRFDQRKLNNNNYSAFNSNFTYTEPLSKTLTLVLNYGLGTSISSSAKSSFNKSALDRYDSLDSLFSNKFRLYQPSNQVGSIFSFKRKKALLNFGTKVSRIDFKQRNDYTGNRYNKVFINWYPQAFYRLAISQEKSIRFEYEGNTTQPTIFQIEPVRENSDPLNITIGNRDLRPSFKNRFNLGYNSFKVLSGRSLYVEGAFAAYKNELVRNTMTDAATGKTTFQWSNLENNTPWEYNLVTSLQRKITKAELTVAVMLNMHGYTGYEAINTIINKVSSDNYLGSVSLSQYKAKKYNFRVSFEPHYSTRRSTFQQQFNYNGWRMRSTASFTIFLPKKFELSSDGNYQYNQKTQSFDQNFERTIWNSSISKKFFKAENLKLSLSGNDLLNQNIGFDRNSYGSIIRQNSYSTIRRYYMASLVWDFNKMGAQVKTQN